MKMGDLNTPIIPAGAARSMQVGQRPEIRRTVAANFGRRKK